MRLSDLEPILHLFALRIVLWYSYALVLHCSASTDPLNWVFFTVRLGELILKGWICCLYSLTSHQRFSTWAEISVLLPQTHMHTPSPALCPCAVLALPPEQRPTCGFTECFSMVVLYRLWECLVWFLPLSLPLSRSLSLCPSFSFTAYANIPAGGSGREQSGSIQLSTSVFLNSQLIMAFLFFSCLLVLVVWNHSSLLSFSFAYLSHTFFLSYLLSCSFCLGSLLLSEIQFHFSFFLPLFLFAFFL